MTSDSGARIYLVRHGETQANRDGIIQGHQDTVLNATGEEQARQVGQTLKDVPFERAYSSDLKRAAQTAEAILAHHPRVELVKDAALRERFLGTMQGRSAKEIGALQGHGAEPAKAFGKRGLEWWETHSSSAGNILAVSHGGLISSLVRALVDSGAIACAAGVRVGECVNGSVTIIDVERRSLVQYASTAHLSLTSSANADDIEATCRT